VASTVEGLAIHGADVFMRSVLELGRYHADLHQSNVFVTPDNRICYLDFGIVGTTAPSQREAIAQVLAATVYGDAERALRYSAELGLEVPQARIAEVARGRGRAHDGDARYAAARRARVCNRFLRIMNDAGVEIPVGYGLLVKALVNRRGCRARDLPRHRHHRGREALCDALIAQQMMAPARLYGRIPEALRAALKVLAG